MCSIISIRPNQNHENNSPQNKISGHIKWNQFVNHSMSVVIMVLLKHEILYILS